MNQFAMAIGYLVMGGASALAVAALWLWALDRMWLALRRSKTWKFVGAAMREWSENHPKEAAKARECEE